MSFKNTSVGLKLALLIVALVGVTFAGFVWLTARSMASALEAANVSALEQRTRMAVDMIAAYDHSLRLSARHFVDAFESRYPAGFEVDPAATEQLGPATVPLLLHDGLPVSSDIEGVDAFSAGAGVAATVFVRSGDDFVRIATSLKKEDGSRALGTVLERTHPAYPELLAGRDYAGKVRLFGQDRMTAYAPVRDAKGLVIGALFVGLECTDALDALKQKLRTVRVGKTGYLYALDASTGPERGTLLVHPAKEGQNILAAKDADGREFIREIVDRRTGIIRYPWMNSELGDTEPREKVVTFAAYEPWGWVVAAGTRTDEFTEAATDLQIKVILLCVAAVLLLSLATVGAIRRLVSRPLHDAVSLAKRIAGGDLTGQIEATSTDETGQLIAALSEMRTSLARMMSDMRGAAAAVTESAHAIAQGSVQIASGSAQISSRTDQQVSALSDTAAAMVSLTESVRHNARDAIAASEQSVSATEIAERGETAARRLVSTMAAIRTSSEKITGIIEIIDSLAFQTNILALNAAVEAARAGEQGRGFAVVASAVHELALRSKEAAREIGTLVTDSVVKVREGTSIAGEAGVQMAEARDAAARVTQLIAQISTASQTQTQELDRLGRTVKQIDDTARENAGIAAEAAGAAEALKRQSAGLTETVVALDVDRRHTARAPVDRAPVTKMPVSKLPVSPAPRPNDGPKANGSSQWVAA